MAAMNEGAGSWRGIGGGGRPALPPSDSSGQGDVPAPQQVLGVCFLKNYSDQNKLVDDQQLTITAYPDDPYSYEAVDGSTKTIPCYTAQTP
jgi:hypothetical protein